MMRDQLKERMTVGVAVSMVVGSLIVRGGYFVLAVWTVRHLAAQEGHDVSLWTVAVGGALVVGAMWILGPRRV